MAEKDGKTERDDIVSVYSRKEKKENKALYIIVSVIIAFALWFYVIQSENPVLQRTFNDVSVQVLNRDVLEGSGYKLLTPDSQTVSVTVEGKRSSLVSMQKLNIFASVDVSQCTEGEHYLNVQAYRPSVGDIVGVNPAQLKVVVDKLVSKEFKADVVFRDSVPGESRNDEYEAVCTDKSFDEVTVTGAKSEIEMIDRVEAEIDTALLTSEPDEFIVALEVFDKEGRVLRNVTLSENEITVEAQLYDVKSVELNVKTTGAVPDNLVVESINVPETVTIIGLEEDLADITEIDTVPVDMSGITETTTIVLEPVLPRHVEMSGRVKEIRATVRVNEKASRIISYPVSNMIVENLYEDLSLSFDSSTVNITVTGTVDNISEVTADKLTVKVDAGSVADGSNTLTPRVTVDVNGAEGVAEDVNVTVSEK